MPIITFELFFKGTRNGTPVVKRRNITQGCYGASSIMLVSLRSSKEAVSIDCGPFDRHHSAAESIQVRLY